MNRIAVTALLLLTLLLPLTLAAQNTWQPGIHYVAGTLVTYSGSAYKCLQTHTSQVDWTPTAAVTLWQLVSGGGGNGCASLASPPSGLGASATMSTGTTLSWSPASAGSGCTVTGYTVYRNGVAVGTASSTTFSVSGLSPATTYSFTVAAIDSFGTSAAGAPLSVTTLSAGGAGACAQPWSASAVYTGGMAASANGTNYSANWWTQGQNPAANSGPAGSGQPWTSTGQCAPCTVSPSVPTGLAASGTTGYSTVLNWAASSPAPNCSVSGYTVYKNGAVAGTTTGTTYVATGLTPATNYTFTVAATDSFGTSAPGSPVPVLTSAGGPSSGTHLFAPYIDMSMTASEQILTIQQQSGIKTFTLAFILGNGSCAPAWGGIGSIYNDALPDGVTMLSLLQNVRAAGGDYIVSFGGANGIELAQACPDPVSLQAAYQAVINRYGARMLDFDIEGGAVADPVSITRRDKALVALKTANPGLVISYTLPVLPSGLDSNGVNVLRSVKADGLTVDVVNVMAMDYGSSVDNGGKMGLNATLAAANTQQQIASAGLTATVGITPMLGVNDVSTEIFQLADAQTLLNFAQSNSYVTRLAMWSVGRDNGDCAGVQWASATCSGLAQSNYQFSSIFTAFR